MLANALSIGEQVRSQDLGVAKTRQILPAGDSEFGKLLPSDPMPAVPNGPTESAATVAMGGCRATLPLLMWASDPIESAPLQVPGTEAIQTVTLPSGSAPSQRRGSDIETFALPREPAPLQVPGTAAIQTVTLPSGSAPLQVPGIAAIQTVALPRETAPSQRRGSDIETVALPRETAPSQRRGSDIETVALPRESAPLQVPGTEVIQTVTLPSESAPSQGAGSGASGAASSDIAEAFLPRLIATYPTGAVPRFLLQSIDSLV